jgi:PAS domain S-box-containing protein
MPGAGCCRSRRGKEAVPVSVRRGPRRRGDPTEAEVRLLLDTLLALAGEDDLLTAIRGVLRLTCAATGFEVGQAWFPAADGDALECAPVWHGGVAGLREFREASIRGRILPGQGLPGRAWESSRAIWIRDAGGARRTSAAARAGLKSGLAAPVLVDGETVAVLEFRARRPRTREAWIVESVSAVANQVGTFVRRRRAETALRQSEDRFRSMVENAADGVVVADSAGRIVSWNRSAREMFGRTEREVLGRPITSILPARHRPVLESQLRRFLDSGVAGVLGQRLALHGRRRGGEKFPLEISLFAWESGGSTLVGAFLRDITRRRTAEEGLRASEERFRSLVESSVFGIYESSARGRLVLANPALVEMLGYGSEKELLGVDIGRDLYAEPGVRDREIRRHGAADRIENLEVDWKRKDGRRIRVRLNGRPVRDDDGRISGYRMVVEDVTGRRALEARLQETHKLEALGRMAGSVAHDFNNVVTAVLGYCELLLDRLPAASPEAEAVAQIRKAGETASALTTQLLHFGRRKDYTPRPVDVDAVLEEMREVLARLVGHEVEFVVQPGARDARVESDPTRIQQVLLNLVVNARDAVGAKGRITVETGRVVPGPSGIPALPGLPAIPLLRLSVTDNGHGMDETVRARLFEPFFTTKEPDRGTGLGLATVHGIVKQGGGEIRVESAPGRGARFDVYLPLLGGDAAAAPGPDPRGERRRSPARPG